MSHQNYRLKGGYQMHPLATEQGCLMQLVTMLTEGPDEYGFVTAEPRCVSEATADFWQGVNDLTLDAHRHKLKPLAARIPGHEIDLDDVRAAIRGAGEPTYAEREEAYGLGAGLVHALGDEGAIAWLDKLLPRDLVDLDHEVEVAA